MILHLVRYQPKESATADELRELVAILQTTSREIPTIRQVRVGRAVDLGMEYSNGSLDQALEYVAIFEFNDKNGLESYLAHPHHVKLSEVFWRLCDQTAIMDIAAVDPVESSLEEFLVKWDIT